MSHKPQTTPFYVYALHTFRWAQPQWVLSVSLEGKLWHWTLNWMVKRCVLWSSMWSSMSHNLKIVTLFLIFSQMTHLLLLVRLHLWAMWVSCAASYVHIAATWLAAWTAEIRSQELEKIAPIRHFESTSRILDYGDEEEDSVQFSFW